MLPVLRSRNIGKGRLEKRAAGRRRPRREREAERDEGSSVPAETAPVKPGEAATRSFPCRKRSDFRLPLAPPPRRAGGGGKLFPGSGSGEKLIGVSGLFWELSSLWVVGLFTALPRG